MSSSHYKLFIDETGHPHQNHKSTHFALVGIVIENTHQQDLKIKTDQLRFKYWDTTDIVLHSEELGHQAGNFKKFATDPELGKRFEKQLFALLHSCPFRVTAAVIDKAKAYSIGWKEDTIVSKASEALVLDFMSYLYGQNAQGRIVYETSNAPRDGIYLSAYHRYLNPQWTNKHTEFSDVREKLTSLTFANKLNHDTEMQIADIFSYAAICKFKQLNGYTYSNGSYESKIIALLDKKLLSTPPSISKPNKVKYYTQIKGLSLLPMPKPKTKVKQRKKTA